MMSTSTLPPPRQAVSILLTAADVARFPTTLLRGDVSYELHDGRLIVMVPPGAGHGRRQARFTAYLFTQGEQPGHGIVFGDVGVILRRKPDHLLGPDAAFLTTDQLPPSLSPEGYLLTIPAIVVEVRSKNDYQPEVETKVADYLGAGVLLVWIADPDARTIIAYRTGETPVVFAATDTLTATGVIPGFAVNVAELLPI